MAKATLKKTTSKTADKKEPESKPEEHFTQAVEDLNKIKSEIAKVIYGQEEVVNLTLTAILAGGHGLIVGVPGLAKTLLVDTFGTVLGLSTKRIQCTPDLMPADVIGTEVLEENAKGERSFRFIEGPVFSNLLMADEINRASPRTQSALLQAMQEKNVTVSGHSHDVPTPFHVLATQNPIEQEGTYPLPEAQLDRFLLQIDVDYPDLNAEKTMLLKTTGSEKISAKKVISVKRLLELQAITREMPVGEKMSDKILSLVRSLRPSPDADEMVKEYIMWAPGPRAAQALMQTAKAYALLNGRMSPSLDDLKFLAPSVLKHRMALTPYAESDGISVNDLIAKHF